MPDDWKRHLDDPVHPRGVRVNIRSIKVDGQPVDITTDDIEIHLVHANGWINMRSPPTVPLDDVEAIDGKRNQLKVRASIPTELAWNAAEEEAQWEARKKHRQATEDDYIRVIREIANDPNECKVFTLPEIYGRLYGISLEEAVGETFRGILPLFAPDFQGLESMAERKRRFFALPGKEQKDLIDKYGVTKNDDDTKTWSAHALACAQKGTRATDTLDGAVKLLKGGHTTESFRVEKWTSSDLKQAREETNSGRVASKAVLNHLNDKPLLIGNRPVYEVLGPV